MKDFVGLGFRRELVESHLGKIVEGEPGFIELAPENWLGIGGYWNKILREAAERYPITSHGLSLSLGGPDPLDWDLLKSIKEFLKEYDVSIYSEHLSFAKCDNAHFYDLLPIPFRESAIRHVSERIRQVQDFLERKVAIENVSYYTPVNPEMDEGTFLRSILEESDCELLLDINNVYVNAFNHNYETKQFIDSLPLERVAYIHMAGHEQRSEDLIIDTHGHAIIDPVYELFDWAIQKIEPIPVLLERDFNFPEYNEIVGELSNLRKIVNKHWVPAYVS